MAAETIILEHPPAWGDIRLKTDCTLRYIPISHEWPAEVTGELAWGPASFCSEEDYTLTLSDDEVSEVKSALRYFNGKRLGILSMRVDADRSKIVGYMEARCHQTTSRCPPWVQSSCGLQSAFTAGRGSPWFGV